MSIENKVLHFMRNPQYVPGSLEYIAKNLELSEKEVKRLRNIIHSLIKEGTIARIKGDRYCISQDADLVSGIIHFRNSGSAVLIPDKPEENPTTIHIYAEDTGVALHKDHVLVHMKASRPRTKFKRGRKVTVSPSQQKRTGKVIRILHRANSVITGTLSKTKMYFHVVPDDPKISRNILVADPRKSRRKPRPKLGDKVVVKLLEWTKPHLNPEGTITRVLGKTHTPGAEFEAILIKYGLQTDFKNAIKSEVERIPSTVPADSIDGRQDCRELFTFTIDPDDAKDFDDALSIEYLDNDITRVGVHIADVSHYVKPNSLLDKEAIHRGNSTYLVGCVIPMLPYQLSNGICSLVEGEDRLTKSVFFTFAKNGKVKKSTIANTVINSNKRLTYKQAYAFLNEDKLENIKKTPLPPKHQTGSTGRCLNSLSDNELKQLQAGIRNLWHIASALRASRIRKGALDFDMPEVKIFVNEDGYADRIERITNDESHQLIEEFMLLANDTIAKTLHEAGMPFISRVHDQPDEEKLNELREYLINAGIQCSDLSNRKELARVLARFKDHPQGHSLKIQFLRSLKQACYRAEADGHYGLSKTFYAHFTSPIRRYADLIIHRLTDHYLQKHGKPTAPKNLDISYTKAKLDSLSRHISITEQQSTEAERESNKVKLLEYFEREVSKEHKTKFQAIISDLKNHGIFVELLESQAYGLIPISSLRDDLYRLSSDRTSIVGRRDRARYSTGDIINVEVAKVDRFRREMDFHLCPPENNTSEH